jgi:N-acetylglutamate synthase-like GNAT family acetyltransferase
MTVARFQINRMTIEYLADYPDALPILAEWQHREWGHLRAGDALEKRRARLEGYSNRDRIPLTVVALEGNEVLGSASLVLHDMETRMELTPWLASVFVGEPYRRRGIGAELVRRIMAEAGKLEVPLLYLYTVHSEKFYAGLGWTLLERTNYREQKVVIMTYVPTRPKP